ncbi:MAG: hypothetical protein KJ952_03555 [Candidatus Omnitrophica bacterium]|nr:hypothetical protein [Candidatus Omnitrophota bacterium]
MNKIFIGVFLFISLTPLVICVAGEDEPVVKTVDGLRFEVPEDRPIEKKHGIVAPMELDKYVAFKFSKVEKRLDKIEDFINKAEEDLRLLKEDMESLKKKENTLKSPK